METKIDRRERRQRQHTTHFQLGLIAVLLFLIAAFKLDVHYEPDIELAAKDKNAFEIPLVVATLQQPDKPLPRKPAVPVAVPDETVVETPSIVFDFAPLDIEQHSFEPVPEPRPATQQQETVSFAEEMPQLIGGLASLMRAIEYPELAKKAGVEGTVYIQFIVDKDGRVKEAAVVKGIGAGCDEAALSALRHVSFEPGKQGGKPVAVRMSIPIRFKLK